jgi:hypothetical protein
MRGVVGLLGQPLQQRQREAGGLAGAGLRGAEQVASRENDRDCLKLDGGGSCIALVRDCAEELRAKPERIERRSNGISPALGLGRVCLRPVQADAF